MADGQSRPFVTGFAADDEGYAEDSGLLGITLFSNAVQVWSVVQKRPTTVAEAALAFNATPEAIRQAVEHHYWMFLDGDVIGHEGE